MEKLTRATYARARAFIRDNGWPLEQAVAAYHLDGAPHDEVVGTLRAFQNGDGGFGHAIEPDFRLEASSVMGTTVALQCLIDMGVPSTHPMVEAAGECLLATVDTDEGR
jgi:hypothetical protein